MHGSTGAARINGHADDDLPPANPEAERGLIASLWALPDAMALPEVVAVRPGDLLDPALRTIYRHLLGAHLDGQSPDVLSARISAAGELTDDVKSAICAVAKTAASGSDARYYADLVRDSAEQRRLWELHRELGQQIRDRLPPADVHGFLAAAVESMAVSAAKTGAKKMSEQLPHHHGLRPAIIHGLLREGETLNIIAPPKTGKSWLTYGLALSVVTGKRWLDTFTPVPGRVLIVDDELHPETLCDRIPRVASAMGLQQSEWADALETITLRGRLKDIHRLAADEFAAIKPGTYKLIVIDALYRVLPPECDENSNAAMAAVYNTIDALAARLQCAFVLIHHSTKGSQSGKAVTDVGAGAGSISRAADTHFVLRAHEEQGAVVADGVTRSWAPLEPFCLRWAWPLWTRADELDPAALKPDKPPRKKPKAEPTDEPVEQPWTAERFAAQFIAVAPALRDAIIDAAVVGGLSERRAGSLLRRATAKGLIHEHRIGRATAYATVAPAPATGGATATEAVAGSVTFKRDAVVSAISDDPDASDSEIAEICEVHRSYVQRIRKGMEVA